MSYKIMLRRRTAPRRDEPQREHANQINHHRGGIERTDGYLHGSGRMNAVKVEPLDPKQPVVITVTNGTINGRMYLKDGGYYDDVYEKTTQGHWRFRSRTFVPEATQ